MKVFIAPAINAVATAVAKVTPKTAASPNGFISKLKNDVISFRNARTSNIARIYELMTSRNASPIHLKTVSLFDVPSKALVAASLSLNRENARVRDI